MLDVTRKPPLRYRANMREVTVGKPFQSRSAEENMPSYTIQRFRSDNEGRTAKIGEFQSLNKTSPERRHFGQKAGDLKLSADFSTHHAHQAKMVAAERNIAETSAGFKSSFYLNISSSKPRSQSETTLPVLVAPESKQCVNYVAFLRQARFCVEPSTTLLHVQKFERLFN